MSIDREYTTTYFKEYRVALVVDDLTHADFNPNTATDEQFYDVASEQGTVFTLQGFMNYAESGELNALMNTLVNTKYLFHRTIPFYEKSGEVYCNNERNTSIEE